MTLPLPEESAPKTVAQAALLGLLSGVPVAGGALAGLIQGSLDAVSRARDEDWWAMVAARVSSLESDVKALIRFDDPEFVAAAHRLFRAAQESGDEEKRRLLASALASAGSWSNIPAEEAEENHRILADLTSRQLALLRIAADPTAWIATFSEEDAALASKWGLDGSETSFIRHVVLNDNFRATRASPRDLIAAVDALSRLKRLGLVKDGPGADKVGGSGGSGLTHLGGRFVRYVERLG